MIHIFYEGEIMIMHITGETTLKELNAQYPWMKAGLAEKGGSFKIIDTVLGDVIINSFTISKTAKFAHMAESDLIQELESYIDRHKLEYD